MTLRHLKKLAKSNSNELRLLAKHWMETSTEKGSRDPVTVALANDVSYKMTISIGGFFFLLATVLLVSSKTSDFVLSSIILVISGIIFSTAIGIRCSDNKGLRFVRSISLLEKAPSLGCLYGALGNPSSNWFVGLGGGPGVWAEYAEIELLLPLTKEVCELEKYSWRKKEAKRIVRLFKERHAILLRIVPIHKDHGYYFKNE